MADITFECPRCGQSLIIDAAGAGIMVNCPKCSQIMKVPEPPAEEDETLKRTQPVLPFDYPKADTRTKAA